MQIPVGAYNINVSYSDKVAHITNDSYLASALSAEGAVAVASSVKTYYQRIKRSDLNVNTTSMAIEIIGHVYPDNAANIIMSASVPQSIKDACASIIRHTSVIDSGESSVDSNRWFWDVIATYVYVTSLIIGLV